MLRKLCHSLADLGPHRGFDSFVTGIFQLNIIVGSLIYMGSSDADQAFWVLYGSGLTSD